MKYLTPSLSRLPGRWSNMLKGQLFKNLFLYCHTCRHGKTIHGALYQNCEMHWPLIRDSDLRLRLLWLYSEHVFNLRKFSFPFIIEKKTKCIIFMSIKPSTKIAKLIVPVSGIRSLMGYNVHVVKMY